jgi:hypothetical protein
MNNQYHSLFSRYWFHPESASQVDRRIQSVLFVFGSASSCANPIIYGLFYIRRIEANRYSQKLESNAHRY